MKTLLILFIAITMVSCDDCGINTQQTGRLSFKKSQLIKVGMKKMDVIAQFGEPHKIEMDKKTNPPTQIFYYDYVLVEKRYELYIEFHADTIYYINQW